VNLVSAELPATSITSRRSDVVDGAPGGRGVSQLVLDQVHRDPSAASSAAWGVPEPVGWTRLAIPARRARRGNRP
jgi:hypothetical protein